MCDFTLRPNNSPTATGEEVISCKPGGSYPHCQVNGNVLLTYWLDYQFKKRNEAVLQSSHSSDTLHFLTFWPLSTPHSPTFFSHYNSSPILYPAFQVLTVEANKCLIVAGVERPHSSRNLPHFDTRREEGGRKGCLRVERVVRTKKGWERWRGCHVEEHM